MIKICSLDFLNKDIFDTDIMTVDGSILFHCGEEITPETILKLYFKEIYIKEYEVEKETEIASFRTEIKEAELSRVGAGTASTTVNNSEATIAKGPHTTEIQIEDSPTNTEPSGPKGPASDYVENINEDTNLGPRHIETEATINNNKTSERVDVTKNSTEDVAVEMETDSDDLPLAFDEEQAKRIVEISVKLGKTLKFSNEDLKELEQTAFYCNIGITKFKQSDLNRRGFSKMKSFASYERLIADGSVPEKVAEAVKFCSNNYVSDEFPLNSKIPSHHIVAIASYYEDLVKYHSKEATLSKMLQMGGNQFNIFVLHKFLKIMKDTNE